MNEAEHEQHEETECQEALHHLHSYLDDEMSSDHRAHVRDHLEQCMPCFEAFDFEAEFRIVVRTKCRDEVPDEVRRRIMGKLGELGLNEPA
jgi:anti-sigma factor (TIGR02949 family)